MTDVITPAKGLTEPATGSHNDEWGAILNANIGLIDTALGGTLSLTISGNVTLTSNQIHNTGYIFSGSFSSPATVTFPNFFGLAVLSNGTNQPISCGILGGAFVTIPSGYVGTIWSDGTDFQIITNFLPEGNVGSATITGPVTSVSNDIAAFNGTSGSVIKDSGLAVAAMLSATSTITALRTATATSLVVNQTYVRGWRIPNDGGEGVFWYNASDTTSTDNGGTIIVDTSGRRWYRETDGIATPVQWFGAYCDGSHDDGAAVRAAIAWCQTKGGGLISFPVGNCLIASGTLAITTNGIRLTGAGKGASLITFQNGTSDCITVVGTLSQNISGFGLSDLQINHSGKTGGRTLYCTFANNIVIANLIVSNAWTLFEFYVNNSISVKDVLVQGITSSSGFACYWHAPVDGSASSSGLYLEDFAVSCGYSGASGIIADGAVSSLLVTRGYVRSANFAMQISNTAGSSTSYPNYVFAANWQANGATSIGLQINAGGFCKFVNCNIFNASGDSGQGSADTNALQINPDTAGSFTHAIKFIGCSIGYCRSSAVVCNARNISFVGCDFLCGVTTPINTLPAIEVSAAATNITIIGCSSQVYGNANVWANGLKVDAGAIRVIESLNDWSSSGTKEVLWSATDPLSFAGTDITSNSPSVNTSPVGNPNGFIGTAGATLTSADMLGGVLQLGGTSGAYTNLTPTAANFVAGLASPAFGKLVDLLLINDSTGTITLQNNTGVTMQGNTATSTTFTIATASARLFKIYFANTTLGSEAVTIYG